jgi:preprotein translocase subunit YajC
VELKVGDKVRIADGQEGTVAVVKDKSVYVSIKMAIGGYLRVANVSELTKIEPPEKPAK